MSEKKKIKRKFKMGRIKRFSEFKKGSKSYLWNPISNHASPAPGYSIPIDKIDL
jgi:hypothetical protein